MIERICTTRNNTCVKKYCDVSDHFIDRTRWRHRITCLHYRSGSGLFVHLLSWQRASSRRLSDVVHFGTRLPLRPDTKWSIRGIYHWVRLDRNTFPRGRRHFWGRTSRAPLRPHPGIACLKAPAFSIMISGQSAQILQNRILNLYSSTHLSKYTFIIILVLVLYLYYSMVLIT